MSAYPSALDIPSWLRNRQHSKLSTFDNFARIHQFVGDFAANLSRPQPAFLPLPPDRSGGTATPGAAARTGGFSSSSAAFAARAVACGHDTSLFSKRGISAVSCMKSARGVIEVRSGAASRRVHLLELEDPPLELLPTLGGHLGRNTILWVVLNIFR